MFKRLFGLLLLATPLWAGSYTSNKLHLYKPDAHENGVATLVNDNFTQIDSSVAVLSTPNTFTAFQTFSSSIAVSSMSIFQLRIATPSYSGTERVVINGTTKIFGPLGAVLSLCDQNGQNCSNISSATITSVTAGTGLSGGGTSGAVTLNVLNTYPSSFTMTSGATVSTMTVLNMIRADDGSPLLYIRPNHVNLFFGYNAGSTGVTGTGNTALGTSVMSSIAGGSGNTGGGQGSLQFITSGNENSGYGQSSLAVLTTANGNTAFGYSSLANVTLGSSNTAVGDYAGYGSVQPSTTTTTGAGNTFVGYGAEQDSASQLNNAGAFGFKAKVNASNTIQLGGRIGSGVEVMVQAASATINQIDVSTLTVSTMTLINRYITTSAGNILFFEKGFSLFVGDRAGSLSAAANNTGIGSFSLNSISTGTNNTAIGEGAMNSAVTGSENSCLGHLCNGSLTQGNYNTSIGGGAGTSLTTGNYNVCIGSYDGVNRQACGVLSNGQLNTMIGNGSGGTSASMNGANSNNTLIGAKTGINTTSLITNATAIGYNAQVTSSNTMVLGGTGTDAELVMMTSATVSGFIQLSSKTAAAIRALTPTATFQYYGCSDCTTVSTCVSTGTTVGSWALITNKGSACN